MSEYLQEVIIAIEVDEDADINSHDRQQYAGQRNCSKLIDKLYTDEHDEAHYHQQARTVDSKIVVHDTRIFGEVPKYG